MAKRNLGNLGESEVSNWCSNQGITYNPSLNDSKGWDLFLQLDSTGIETPNIESLVQVKSTTSLNPSIQIKLSNWKNLTTTEIPAFIVVLQYDAVNSNPKNVILYHVDRSMIIKTLVFLRKLETNNQQHKINKQKLSVPLKKGTILTAPYPKSFEKEIRSVVGNILEYKKDKLELIRSYGKSAMRKLIISTLNHKPEPFEFLDWLLGNSEMDVDTITEISTRFNIEKIESKKLVKRKIKSPVNLEKQAVLILKDSQSSEKAELPVKVKSARFSNQYKKVMISGTGLNINYDYENTIAVSGHTHYESIKEIGKCNLKEYIKSIHFEHTLNSISIKGNMMEMYLKKGDRVTHFMNYHPSSFILSAERQKFLEVFIKFNEIILEFKLDNDLEIDNRLIWYFQDKILETHKILSKGFGYEAKFDSELIIPSKFNVPLIRGIVSGGNYVILMGIVEFKANEKPTKCECCGRMKYFSDKYIVIHKKIVPIGMHEVINEVMKRETYLAYKDLKNQLIYDSSIDLKGDNDSIIDPSKFNINFTQNETIANKA